MSTRWYKVGRRIVRDAMTNFHLPANGDRGAAVRRSITRALEAVRAERYAQEAKWGEQNHPDGTGSEDQANDADRAREICEAAFQAGNGTWRHILVEEVCEALAESDPDRLRAELVQVAAVSVAWVEAIDRRIDAVRVPSEGVRP